MGWKEASMRSAGGRVLNLFPHHQRSRVYPCQRVGVDGRCVTAIPSVRPSLLLFAGWGPPCKQEPISHAAAQTLLPNNAQGAVRVRHRYWVEGSFAASCQAQLGNHRQYVHGIAVDALDALKSLNASCRLAVVRGAQPGGKRCRLESQMISKVRLRSRQA
jgi:hypothetical protein